MWTINLDIPKLINNKVIFQQMAYIYSNLRCYFMKRLIEIKKKKKITK